MITETNTFIRAPPNAILAPNFKFQDMGIGGLDTEFSEIFRRAFASRVFPPGLVEKLGIEHVKGLCNNIAPASSRLIHHLEPRYITSWPPRNWKDPNCKANRQDAKCQRT